MHGSNHFQLLFLKKIGKMMVRNRDRNDLNCRIGWEMSELRRVWAVWAVACVVGLVAIGWGLNLLWETEMVYRWLIPAGGVLLYQLVYLYRHLDENRDQVSGKLYHHLGLPNWLTVSRGAVLALVAGFVLVPRPEGWLAWAPAVMYVGAMLVDYLDGYVARISGVTTRLGARLDMHYDSHGYIIGGLLIVLWGQAPPWYLLVALAWPLYVLGERILVRQNKPLRPLYPNPFRRVLSGAQMGFTAVLLFPVFTPPGTTIAATLYMLPFLTNFLLDGLWVSGILPEGFIYPGQKRTRLMRLLRDWLPLLLRVALAALLILRALRPGSLGTMGGLYTLLHGAAALAILTGSAGRAFAVGAMLLSGLYLRADVNNVLAWGILLAALLVFFSGTGRYSLWKPEDYLIYRIAGEKVET
jgi:CDP-diacylglycerol---glycerol-3-phosphate 3-phosphatidyltransferase